MSRGRPRSDRGTTLAEVTVSMLVFGLLGTFLATSVVQTTRLTKTSAVRENTAQRASLLAAQVTKDLRTAVEVGADATSQTSFTTAEAHTVAFYSSATPRVVRERLSFATSAADAAAGVTCTPSLAAPGCVLWREKQQPDDASAFPDLRYTDPSRITVQRVVSSELPHTVTFGYLLKGSASAVSSVTDAVARQSIVAVHVRIAVDGDGAGRVKPVVLESTVHPYNG